MQGRLWYRCTANTTIASADILGRAQSVVSGVENPIELLRYVADEQRNTADFLEGLRESRKVGGGEYKLECLISYGHAVRCGKNAMHPTARAVKTRAA